MDLKSLARSFSARSRNKGEQCWHSGLVTIVERSANAVRARVRGTQVYEVSLHLEEDTLVGRCECPYFDDTLDPCKHLWATVLAANSEGLLPLAGRGTQLLPDFDEDEEELGLT